MVRSLHGKGTCASITAVYRDRGKPRYASTGGISRQRAGFTLVEVLVSTVFLAIAFLTLVSVIAAGRVTVKKAYYTVRAASAAANVLDAYSGEGYDGISGTSYWVVTELPGGNSTTGQVSDYAGVTNSTALKMATVTTTWPGDAETPYAGGSVVFRTLVADRSSEGDYRSQRGY